MTYYRFTILLVLSLLIIACAAYETKEVAVVKKDRLSLGVVVTDLPEDRRKELNVEGGAEIKRVVKNSAAEEAGLQKGDIIIRFDGKDIRNSDQLRDIIRDMEEEKSVEVVVLRDGKQEKFTAELKAGRFPFVHIDPPDVNLAFPPDFPFHGTLFHQKGGYLGVETSELSDQLKEYFEVQHGVLIEKVVEESPAEKSGLKAGDVILEIEGKEIHDYADLIRTLNYYDPETTVEITYSRKGKKQTANVTLGDKKDFRKSVEDDNGKFRFRFFHRQPDERILERLERVPRQIEHHLERIPEHFERHLEYLPEILEESLDELDKNLKKIEVEYYLI